MAINVFAFLSCWIGVAWMKRLRRISWTVTAPCLGACTFLTLPMLQAQEATPHPLLPKEAFNTFQKHAEEVYASSLKVQRDLLFPAQDERILLHLPKRGFRRLVALLDAGNLLNEAASTLFMPELDLRSGSKEEGVTGYLLSQAMVNEVLANRYACFRLMRELAPSPEAMRLEEQAGSLAEKLNANANQWTRISFMESLESTRKFFDQLRDLPKMTSEEFARERAESAVLAPREYLHRASIWTT